MMRMPLSKPCSEEPAHIARCSSSRIGGEEAEGYWAGLGRFTFVPASAHLGELQVESTWAARLCFEPRAMCT